MAQIKTLKINSSGFTEEHGASDDVTFATLTGSTQVAVTGGVTLTNNITFNAVTDTIAGIQNQNLLDKTDSETISANWTVATGYNFILTDAPTLGTHAVNKDYADLLAQGNKRKDNCVVATTGNITLSGEQTIDGVLTSTSRVLVWQQTDPKENGLYVSAAGSWTRTLDANTGTEILGALTLILQGSTHAGRQFQNSNSTAPTIGVDNITFVNLGSGVLHNNLSGLQGGTTNEYYHMTAAEDTFLAALVGKAALGTDVLVKNVNDTITANYTFNGDLNVSGGALELPTSADLTPLTGGVYVDAANKKLYAYDGSAYFDVGGTGSASSVVTTYTAGAGGIAQYDAVYVSANNTILKAQANADATSRLIGFAPAAISAASSGIVQENGLLAGVLSGATAGTPYFLSASVAGGVTATAPSGSGNSVVQVGIAKNATDLQIRIQFIGKKA